VPLALHSLQESRIQTALQPLAALTLNGPKQSERSEPLKLGTSGLVALALKNSVATGPLQHQTFS
jgi:hypothetical protein